MLPPYVTRGDPGTEFPIMIDGIPISRRPSELPIPSDPNATRQKMKDGRFRTWVDRPSFAGVDLGSRVFSMTLDLKSVRDDLISLEYISAYGGNHLVTIWRPTCIRYELPPGVSRLYLPHARKCAPHFYSGVEFSADGRNLKVNTDQFITDVFVDGEPLTVTYAAGPTLSTPASGGIVIAKNAETSGVATEYVPMLLGDVPNGGEQVEMWTFLTFICRMRSEVRLEGGISESHVYVFEEE